MAISNIASSIYFFFILSFFAISGRSQTSNSTRGQWKLLKSNIGISAMHVVQLPNDMVIIFDRTGSGPSNISLPSSAARPCLTPECSAHSVEFDPSTRRVRPLTVLTDTWCSSGALSPNGTLVQTGGYKEGDHAVRYFAPCDGCDWSEDVAGLTVKRWYASDHILPDGRIVVVGGRGQFNYEFVPPSAGVFELPFLRETKDPAAENNLYPFVHLSTDGNLFIFANNKAILLDYGNHRVVRSFPPIPGGFSRNYPSSGSSVLLPLQLRRNVEAEIMICGGARPEAHSAALNGTFLPASNTCGRLTITDESPEWKMEEMPIGRVMGDMVLLPTGDVLIINGAAKGTAGWTLGREPVLFPVLYHTGISGLGKNPKESEKSSKKSGKTIKDETSEPEEKFQVLSSSSTPRLYHSTAHLLSDGRVVVGGSNPNARYEFTGVLFPTELSLEAFYPPYFDNTSRPVITGIKPATGVGYGERLSIGFRSERGEDEEVAATMVAPAFTSHSFSMNQRVLVLEVERVAELGGGYFTADGVAPETAVVAPPGYYMVFVVHGGVPSRGKWIRIA